METQSLQLQKRLFTEIEKFFPDKTAMIKDLSSILTLSENAVYKRLSGYTLLNLDDLIKLCKRFNLQIDSFFNTQKENLIFNFPPLIKSPETYIEYLEPLTSLVKNAQGIDSDKIEVWYATNEFPFYHYFFFKELSNCSKIMI